MKPFMLLFNRAWEKNDISREKIEKFKLFLSDDPVWKNIEFNNSGFSGLYSPPERHQAVLIALGIFIENADNKWAMKLKFGLAGGQILIMIMLIVFFLLMGFLNKHWHWELSAVFITILCIRAIYSFIKQSSNAISSIMKILDSQP